MGDLLKAKKAKGGKLGLCRTLPHNARLRRSILRPAIMCLLRLRRLLHDSAVRALTCGVLWQDCLECGVFGMELQVDVDSTMSVFRRKQSLAWLFGKSRAFRASISDLVVPILIPEVVWVVNI